MDNVMHYVRIHIVQVDHAPINAITDLRGPGLPGGIQRKASTFLKN
jgi:hypothetical protein